MHDNRRFSPAPVGIASLLCIFAVLCLTVFALLTLSAVRTNQQFSDRAAETVSAYYEADCLAQELLARLRSGQRPEEVSETDGVFSYRCRVTDTQVLEAAVYLREDSWEILRWQLCSHGEWEAEDRLPVWSGEPE